MWLFVNGRQYKSQMSRVPGTMHNVSGDHVQKITLQWNKLCAFKHGSGPGSSVGIATELRAGRSGDRIPVAARFSAPIQTGPGAHPASCTIGTRSFPGVKSGRGVTLTSHPLLVPLVMKE